jgi:hypothetical protein
VCGCLRSERRVCPRSSGELEVFLDAAQPTLQDDHLLVEGRHGLLLCLGGGAVQAADLADELNVTVDPLPQGLDVL